LLLLVVSPIVNVAVTYAIGEVFLGRPVTASQALRYAKSVLMPLLGTAFLATLLIALGVLALIIPGLYLMLAYMLVWQIGVVEQQFGMAALRRSRALMRGNLRRGAAVLLVSGLLVAMLVGVAAFVFGLVPFAGPIGSQLAQATGSIYTSAVSVLLYFDIRCRKEAFDLEHLAQAVHAAANDAPSLPAAGGAAL
jgi:hypothetical protein